MGGADGAEASGGWAAGWRADALPAAGPDCEPAAAAGLLVRAVWPGRAWASAAVNSPVRPTDATVAQRIAIRRLPRPMSR